MLSRQSTSSTGSSHARYLLRASRPTARQSSGAAGLIARQQPDLQQSRSSSITTNSRPCSKYLPKVMAPQWVSSQRHSSTAASVEPPAPDSAELSTVDKINVLIERIAENEENMVQIMDELDLLAESEDADDLLAEFMSNRDLHTTESWVNLVRQQFGDTIPEGVLEAKEIKLYTSLYGEPIVQEFLEETIAEEEEGESDQLFREDAEGNWEEVEYKETAESEDDLPVVYDMEIGPEERETIAMQRTREVAEQLGGEIMLEQFENEAVPDSAPRAHPLTQMGQSQTDPSTIHPPKDSLTGPISVILSEVSNRHVAETAHRLFGGPGLPHSTTTPPPRAQLPQLPIPIHASQHYMANMEANAYLAVLYPGIYASALSVLVEIRKRLGTDWLRNLISQEGGPNVLDASGGGAGILAWRDVLRAEYETMVPDHPREAPVPYGRSTVVTGSDALRLRASAILENTTFLPRLPDYLHVREKPTIDDSREAPKRKQFDVIIAPHSLLGFEEEYERKEYVEKLWALLNPEGGILILLEKGRQKGFEAIAGAREMLLKRHISSPDSTEYNNSIESPNENVPVTKGTGMIIAPCTNHSPCPMHNPAGPSKGRKDYCHFEQRYIRPPFLQRIMGAKDRNHEDVKFSYLAVQRGVDMRQELGIQQNAEATDAAFEGFEDAEDLSKIHPLSLPRAVYPPLKRRGHVIFDLCTPAGKIERWTVPRSYSRQAYRDARKSSWGDLWALGAKTRIPRNLNLGDKHGEGKKERLARRAADRAAREEEELEENERDEEDEDDELDEARSRPDLPEPIPRKKGETIPSWKKHNDKKKMRQALKRQVDAENTP
ncbi:Ribosomal protein Rsm22 bacterial-type [Penicillium longicatenatum]|nr:Ribosomal protein Rsm22 bacterial-type [Penicillium longicatenatum]